MKPVPNVTKVAWEAPFCLRSTAWYCCCKGVFTLELVVAMNFDVELCQSVYSMMASLVAEGC